MPDSLNECAGPIGLYAAAVYRNTVISARFDVRCSKIMGKTGACLNECAVKLRFSAVLLYTGAAYSSIQSVDEKGNSTKGRCKGGNIG